MFSQTVDEFNVSLKKFFALLFLLVSVIWILCTVYSFYDWSVLELKARNFWKASRLYPLPKNYETHKLSLIDYLKEKTTKAVTTGNRLLYYPLLLRREIDKNILGYNLTTSLCGIQNDPVNSGGVILKHSSGMLSNLVNDVDITENFEKFRAFATEMMNEGRNFILLMPPAKPGTIDDSYMGVYTDYSEKINSWIINECRKSKIDVINLSEIVKSENIKEEDLFFMTDHHWLPQSGLWACKILSEHLKNYGYEIDTSIFDLSNYEIKYNENVPMLGSLGSKVTSVYVDTEFLPMVFPKYNSDLDVFSSTLNKNLHGSISETLFDFEKLSYGGGRGAFQYSFYTYGDQKLIEIHNNLKHDGKKILIVKESMADVMVPYITNSAEYINVVDVRAFDGSLHSYVSKNNPDTIIFVYGVSGFSDQRITEPIKHPFNFD